MPDNHDHSKPHLRFSSLVSQPRVGEPDVRHRVDTADLDTQYRKQLKEFLETKGFQVQNARGSDTVSLDTQERHIIDNDAFVFFPHDARISKATHHRYPAKTRDMLFQQLFHFISLIVAVQINDENIRSRPWQKNENGELIPADENTDKVVGGHEVHKPIFVIDSPFWQDMLQIIQHLKDKKTLSQDPKTLYSLIPAKGTMAGRDQAILDAFNRDIETAFEWRVPELREASEIFIPDYDSLPEEKKGDKPAELPPVAHFNNTDELESYTKAINKQRQEKYGSVEPDFKVCVFCSATTKVTDYHRVAYNMGRLIGNKGWGLVSGGGAHSMMGYVNQGAQNAGAWTCGVQTEEIGRLEGYPLLNKTLTPKNIYTRMQNMIDESDAFVVLPGGMGSMQEFMALLLLKHQARAHNEKLRREYIANGGEQPQYDMMQFKPIIIQNHRDHETGQGFWEPLVKLARNYGFDRDFEVVTSNEKAIEVIERHKSRLPERLKKLAEIGPSTDVLAL